MVECDVKTRNRTNKEEKKSEMLYIEITLACVQLCKTVSLECTLRFSWQILPGLYVGSVRDSKDQEQLRLNNITHIISIHDNPKRGIQEVWRLIFSYSLCCVCIVPSARHSRTNTRIYTFDCTHRYTY